MEEEKPQIRIFIAAPLIPEAEAFLVHHQCTVECHLENSGFRTTVTLPYRSVRTRKEVIASERYAIALPDGTQLREVYDPGMGTSALFIPAQSGKEVSDATLFEGFAYEFHRKPLLCAGRARLFHDLEPKDYSGDYDFVVSREDFQGLRARYPGATYFTGDLDDECIRAGNFEFYETFGNIPYTTFSADAVAQGDHLVVSLLQLLTMALITLEAKPGDEKLRNHVVLIRDKIREAS